MERFGSTSRRGFSVRSIFTSVFVVVVTAFLLAIFGSITPTQAQAPSANWAGESIVYDGHAYNKVDDFKDNTNTIPAGATVFQAPLQDGTSSSSAKRALILYFSPGVDPPTATTANVIEFDFANGNFSNPTNQKSISLTLKGEEEAVSSCSVQGVGWLICPVSVFLAGAMDSIFDILSGMIAVQPSILGDPNNSMYVAWNVMRNIANIAFVIVFLLIIYSQITSVGISNYSIKKLLPRLIVAAVLVNISFIISALAIDISNILGYSFQNVFNIIREDVFHVTNDTFGPGINSPWSSLTAIILAGGGVAGGIYFVAAGGLYLLVPLLLGLVLTIIFVVVILAARQAIIVILVIIAPLAFVANLLPNTEKLFDKWKDLFLTMLIFFPAFSLVFGGSQLAGQLIIQNAGDNIIMVLFGMAVQIAPLVVTPLLLKLSGGLLGRIAQIANDPRKGLLDRNKNWANDRAKLHRNRNIERDLKGRSRLNPLLYGTRMNKAAEFRRRRLQDNIANSEQGATNRYHQDGKYEKIHETAYRVGKDKEIIEAGHSKHIQDKVNRPNSALYLQNARLEAGKRALEEAVEITKADVKEFENGKIRDLKGNYINADSGVINAELAATIKQIKDARRGVSIESMRGAKADEAIQRDLAEALSASVALRTRAGGVRGREGIESVLAAAKVAVQKATAEDIKNIQESAGLKPGDMQGAANALVDAINTGNSIRARAFQNMLVSGGGSGMEKYRETIIGLGAAIPADVSEDMRENLLDNHGAAKAKASDLITWAAKGGLLESHTNAQSDWAGMSNGEFIGQHPKTQLRALATDPYDHKRAQEILAADKRAGDNLSPEIKALLEKI